MATNTGSNGGKNNTGGVIRGGTEGFPERGLASALEQQAYRKEYSEKVFKEDTGYLATNLKVLQDQAKYYEDMLKSSKDLDAVQTKMYKKRLAETRQLEAQNKQIQSRREASETEILKLLRDSHKARLKQLDEEYKKEMNNIKAVGKAREEEQKKIAAHYAAEMELVQDELDEIEAAADKAGKATKKVTTGLAESVKDITGSLTNLVNMINLESLANNEYTKKANERYEVINKLNRTLGFDLQQGTNAYNSITAEFKTFNNNIGNLFNIDDMREYMQNAATMGLTNEKALKDNLQQSVIANKYMGLNYDTQTSMYKYMKITNNNDAIASYNKMMVALTRKNVGINEDMLSEMIKSGQTTNDILAASGVDVAQYNQGKMAMVGSLKEKGYTDDMAQQMVGMVDNAIQSLYNGDYQSLVGMGINPNKLNSMTTGGASFDALYDYIVGARKNTNSSARGIGAGIIGMGEYNKALGRDISGEALASIYGNEDSETAKNLMKEVQNISEQDVTNYTEQNTAIDSLTKLANKNNVWLEDTFGNSWFNYSKMAMLAFGAAIAGNVVNSVIGIGKGIGGLVKFFGAKGGSGGLATLLSGSVSGGTTSALAPVLSTLGPIAIGVGIAAAAAKSIASKNDKDLSNTNTAAGNLYQAYTEKGMNSVQASVKSQDEAQAENKGGLFSNQYGMNMMVKDQDGIYHGDAMPIGAGNIGQSDLLSAFDWSDDREYFLSGYTNPFLVGSEEARNALKDKIKSHDALGYNKIKAYALAKALGSQGLSDGYHRSQVLAAIMAAALYQGRLNDNDLKEAFADPKTFNFNQWQNTKEGIKSYMQEAGLTSTEQISKIYALLDAYDSYFMFKDGEFLGYPNNKEQLQNMIADFSLDGYHLAGLDRVPKDNYRALLHKDEMVLNKSDAEAYREMFGQITGRNGTGVGGYGVGDRPFNGPYVINAGYPTYSSGKHHGGIDLSFQANTPVGSAAPGTVARSEDLTNSDGSYRSYGRLIVIKGDNWTSFTL